MCLRASYLLGLAYVSETYAANDVQEMLGALDRGCPQDIKKTMIDGKGKNVRGDKRLQRRGRSSSLLAVILNDIFCVFSNCIFFTNRLFSTILSKPGPPQDPHILSFTMAGITNFNPEKDIPSLAGKVIFVTGGKN